MNTLQYSYSASSGGNAPTIKYYYSTASDTPLTSLDEGVIVTSFIVFNLLLNQPYQYYIIAVGLSGETEIWRSSVLTQGTVPYITGNTPSNLLITPGINSLTYSSFEFTGGNPSTVKYYYSANNNIPLDFLQTNISGTSFTFTDLSLNQLYQYYIIAIGFSGTTAVWRNSVLIQGTPYIIGSAPSNVSITPGLNSLTYSFTGSSGGNPSTVKYYYSTSNDTPLSSLGTGVTDLFFTLTDLSLNQPYQYYIIAVGLSGETEIWRTSILSHAATPYIQGTAPSNIVITPGLNSLTYSFTGSSGGNPSTVKYYYFTNNNTPLSSLGNGTTDLSFTLTDLSSNPYQYYIIAIGFSGETEIWRNSILSYTATPYIQGTAPSDIAITPGLNSLTYSFTGSTGGNPSTVKYYYSTNNSTPLSLLGTGTTETTIKLQGLYLNRPYQKYGMYLNVPYQYYIIAIGFLGTTEIWRSATLTEPSLPYSINMYNSRSNDLQKYCELANCQNQVTYNQLKTGTNDPSISKRMRYSQYIKSASSVGKCSKILDSNGNVIG